jgi:hypothetical protein
MPPKVSPHFLGLQLSVDALRATIVDEQLELVGSEHVDFDVEFPEYQYVRSSCSLLTLFCFKDPACTLLMSRGHEVLHGKTLYLIHFMDGNAIISSQVCRVFLTLFLFVQDARRNSRVKWGCLFGSGRNLAQSSR